MGDAQWIGEVFVEDIVGARPGLWFRLGRMFVYDVSSILTGSTNILMDSNHMRQCAQQ